MYEEICEKCKVTFFTPTQFKQHICAAPPPANDELASTWLGNHGYDKELKGSLVQLLTQVAARATLKEHDELCRDCRNYRQNTQEKRDLMGYERCERGAELQKAVTGG